METFRSLIASEVVEKLQLNAEDVLQKLQESLAKMEQQLDEVMVLLKQQDKDRSAIRTLRDVLTPYQ